jgi:hypothetical protein
LRPVRHLRCRPTTKRRALACVLLLGARMTKVESWTIPFLVVEWTIITVGFIMAMAVVLMH